MAIAKDEDAELRSVALQNAEVIREQRLRVEQELDEIRGHLAAIVQFSDDAIISKTLDGVIRSWNAGAERLFGYTSEEAVGQPITLIIPPERMEEERMIIGRLRRGERIEHYETVRVAKHGQRRDISLTVSPIVDSRGRIIGASKIARDITDRKRMAEEAARRAAELAEADKKKDEFIALLAHELRNPLAPLRMGLQVMRLAAGDAAAMAQAQSMMDRQLSHMVRLIDDLLDVSRLTQHKLHLQKSRVSLGEVVSYAVEVTAPAIAAAGHELHVSLPPEPVFLDADLARLGQVIGNLLSNSAKYTERGGQIWLTAQLREGTAVLCVRDTGIGIPAHALPGIFDMFSQVDREVERASGGLGIGLALVKGLVEMHGGSVTAESPGAGKGTTFMVRLPVAGRKPAAPAAGPVAAEPSPRASNWKVLVVDDNSDAAELMATMLELRGNEAHVVNDGLAAVAAAERLLPDLVLMDIGLPRLNGYEATRKIREQPWGGHMKIIALTGWGQDKDRERSKAAGCDGHLVKPVALAELEKLLAGLPRREPRT